MATLQQLRDEYKRLVHPDSINESIEVIDIYCNFFITVITKHAQENNQTADELEAKLVLHMMMTKALHLKGVIKGISFSSREGVTLHNIIDPTIIASMIRNIYETTGMFNLIYRVNQKGDEREIAYNLWVISGLKYRQRFTNFIKTEESSIKQQLEQVSITSLISKIENTELYKNLSADEKKKIQTLIKNKDYLIRFNNNRVVILHWQELSNAMGCDPDFFTNIYTYFSLYTHPSNVAVFQFREMFKPEVKSFVSMATLNMKFFFMMASIFIADYINLFPIALQIFNTLDVRDQIIINAANTLARGFGYSINDSWKELG